PAAAVPGAASVGEKAHPWPGPPPPPRRPVMKSTIRTLFASALIVSLIAGCQTTGGQQTAGSTPSGQEREGMSRTQKGALIGAAIGAVAGLLSGDDATERRQRALIGAGV